MGLFHIQKLFPITTKFEIRRVTFERVESNGLVIMRYQTDRLHSLYGWARGPLRFSDGSWVDFRVKSASYRKQEAIVEYPVKDYGREQ